MDVPCAPLKRRLYVLRIFLRSLFRAVQFSIRANIIQFPENGVRNITQQTTLIVRVLCVLILCSNATSFMRFQIYDVVNSGARDVTRTSQKAVERVVRIPSNTQVTCLREMRTRFTYACICVHNQTYLCGDARYIVITKGRTLTQI